MDEGRAECRQDVVEHIKSLVQRFQTDRDTWENDDLLSFLQAMAAWLQDCDGYYQNINPSVNASQPSWQLLADALSAAAVYE